MRRQGSRPRRGRILGAAQAGSRGSGWEMRPKEDSRGPGWRPPPPGRSQHQFPLGTASPSLSVPGIGEGLSSPGPGAPPRPSHSVQTLSVIASGSDVPCDPRQANRVVPIRFLVCLEFCFFFLKGSYTGKRKSGGSGSLSCHSFGKTT